LRKVVGAAIHRWNDAPERTQDEVIRALNTAIAIECHRQCQDCGVRG